MFDVVYKSMSVAFAQKMEVVGEEISSVESETLGANLILRHYSNKDFSRSKLNIKIRGGRIFGKLVVLQKM